MASIQDFPDQTPDSLLQNDFQECKCLCLSCHLSLFGCLKSWPRLIILFWVLLSLGSLYPTAFLLGLLRYNVYAPEGSVGATGAMVFDELYENQVLDIFVVTAPALDNNASICEDANVTEILANVTDLATEIAEELGFSSEIMKISSCLEYYDSTSDVDIADWKYTSDNDLSTFMEVWTKETMPRGDRIIFADTLLTKMRGFREKVPEYTLGWTGHSFEVRDRDRFDWDIFWTDLQFVMLSIVVVAMFCTGWRVLTIAGPSFLATILPSYALLALATSDPLIYILPISKSVALALNLVHISFFDLHYRNAKSQSLKHETAVKKAVNSVALPILATTSILATLSILFAIWGLNSTIMWQIACSTLFVQIMSGVCALTLTPALVLAFPRFFSKFYHFPFDPNGVRVEIFGDDPPARLSQSKENAEKLDNRDVLSRKYAAQRSKRSTKYPWNILWLIIIVNILVPVSLKAVQLTHTADATYLVSYETESSLTRVDFWTKWPGHMGFYDPWELVLVPAKQTGTFPTNATFIILKDIREKINTYLDTNGVGENVLSIESVGPTAFTYVEGLKANRTDLIYQILLDELTTELPYWSTLMYVYSPYFYPDSFRAEEFVNWLRSEVVAGFSDDSNYEIYLTGANVSNLEAMLLLFKWFNWIMLTFAIIACAQVYFFFRLYSAVLRFLLMVCIPPAFLLSMIGLIYEYHLLDWTQVRSVNGQMSGPLHWFPHFWMLNFFITLYLGFECYMLSMMVQQKLEGHEDEAVVLITTSETWRPVSSVCVAFLIYLGARTGTEVTAESQVAILVVFGMLLDLFVLRLVLLPALVSALGSYNWSPKQVPSAGLQEIDFARYGIKRDKRDKASRKRRRKRAAEPLGNQANEKTYDTTLVDDSRFGTQASALR